MTWSKTLTRTVAMPRSTPVTPEVRWGLAESVWRYAEANGLIVQSFREVEPRRAEDVPASAGRTLGTRTDELDWHVFEAVVTRA